jgi:hypothetical protein
MVVFKHFYYTENWHYIDLDYNFDFDYNFGSIFQDLIEPYFDYCKKDY